MVSDRAGVLTRQTTHQIKPPRHESSTTQPRRTPYDETSNGEGRGEAVSGDDEVEGSEDDTNTSNGVDEWQSRRGEARDEATGDEEGREAEGDEEGQETRKGTREVEETTNVDEDGQYTLNEAGDLPPEPPPPTPHLPTPEPPQLDTAPSPSPPERRDGDVDTAKSNKTPAQRCADAVHDPGGDMKAPDSKPPSVRLEGETVKTPCGHDGRRRALSQRAHRAPRRSGKGARGKWRAKGYVKGQDHRVDQPEDERVEPGDRGVEETKSKEVKGKIGGQSEGDGGHRDGRMIDTGSPTSGTSHDSKRVETGVLPDNETSQQHNGVGNQSSLRVQHRATTHPIMPARTQ
jgi:hypothetical protein